VALGIAVGRVFDIAERQGDLRLSLGAHNRKVAGFAYADILYGDTTAGLRVIDGSMGLGLDLRFTRYRLGGGTFLGTLRIQRATFDGHSQAYSVGAFVHTSADLYTFGFRDDHALYVDLTARGEGFIGGTTGQLVLSAGFRY
jgi:hypothetical protein